MVGFRVGYCYTGTWLPESPSILYLKRGPLKFHSTLASPRKTKPKVKGFGCLCSEFMGLGFVSESFRNT